MKELNRTTTNTLPGIEQTAQIHVERVGQDEPSRSDLVCVAGVLRLPADEDGLLIGELQFGDRVKLGGSPLEPGWGTPVEGGGYREKAVRVKAQKWATAMDEVELALNEMLGDLLTALVARQGALEDADDELF